MLLDLKQAAEKAGLQRRTLGQWIWRVNNGLPLHEDGRAFVRLVKTIGRSRRIDERDLERWIIARRNGGRAWAGAEGELSTKIRALADQAESEGRHGLAEALRGVAALAGEARSEHQLDGSSESDDTM